MSAISREGPSYPAGTLLDRALDVRRVNVEVLAYVVLVLVSIATHLWGLERMALHHDESVTAWTAWRFFKGSGGFTCYAGRIANTYCYDPVFHGPSYYMFTVASFFLFGEGDAQARLPEAIAGILLVASSWMLRPYLGRRGAFLAGVLMALSPSILYYTRFSRHDGLILLFTLWIVIGFFRYLDTGRARWLYLLAASAALAVTTHELYYILFFVFSSFLLIRLLDETMPRRPLLIGLSVVVGLSVVIEIWNPRITPTLSAAGMAFLFMVVALNGLLMMRVWNRRPIVSERLAILWREQRGALWAALGIFVAIYVLFYTTFFADIRGAVEGLYAGLAYWLGSQQEYRRADQPWFYYFMLLPLYEPLGFFGSIAAAVYVYTRGVGRRKPGVEGRKPEDAGREDLGDPSVSDQGGDGHLPGAAESTPDSRTLPPGHVVPLFPLFLVFWFTGNLVAFSWAGEKMPWLVTHIALPANLLAAWGLGKLLDIGLAAPEGAGGREEGRSRAAKMALVPVAVTLLLVALAVALWRLGTPAEDQAGQSALLQGLVPLAIVGALIYGILTLAQSLGRRVTLSLCALTVAALTGAYMIRATWMVVYAHPDTPRELLIYTQSSPDTRLIAQEIRTLAINQTRNNRSASDPIGGLSMPVIMDSGGENGEGSLAWPMQWYFRDFQRMENRNADFFRSATAESFRVDSPRAGEQEYAPVAMIYTPHVYESTRQALEENYVKRYDSKLNWWFPEGSTNRCDVQAIGYSRFYFAYPGGVADALARCPGIDTSAIPGLFDLLAWPFDRSHWDDLGRFIIYRDLPPSMPLNGREMQVWVRNDLAPTGAVESAESAAGPVKLVAQQSFTGSGQGQLAEPRGIAVDGEGNVYISDTANHRVQVFAPDGTLIRTIGSFGGGDGQLNEPRGLAVDVEGNLYVADTWNARISKFGPDGAFLTSWGEGSQDFGGGRRATMTDGTVEGNAAEPLGFFGPRGVAVDGAGNVYVADTGNKRVVVTDGEGRYLYQWGSAGAEPGQFSEPIGVAVDGAGSVYVADTWNGRVQVFEPGESSQVAPVPTIAWRVPGWASGTYDDPFLAAGPGGQIFVSVPSRNQVLYANPQGDVLLRWGGAGSDTASLSAPSGVAVAPDGTVLVADRGNARALRFQIPQIAAPGEAPAQP